MQLFWCVASLPFVWSPLRSAKKAFWTLKKASFELASEGVPEEPR